MTIRSEQPGDQDGIYAVHAASFRADHEARLVDLLRDQGKLALSLVAVIRDEIVGHVAFSPVTAGDAIGGGLGPVAVLPEFRRRGIAAALICAGIARCRAAGAGWIVVLGSPAYYARFGFRRAADFGLTDEFGGGDAFQVIELVKGTAPLGAGIVKYCPQFSTAGS